MSFLYFVVGYHKFFIVDNNSDVRSFGSFWGQFGYRKLLYVKVVF